MAKNSSFSTELLASASSGATCRYIVAWTTRRFSPMLSFHSRSLKHKPLPSKDFVLAIPSHERKTDSLLNIPCIGHKNDGMFFLVLNAALSFHSCEHDICRFLVDRSDSRWSAKLLQTMKCIIKNPINSLFVQAPVRYTTPSPFFNSHSLQILFWPNVSQNTANTALFLGIFPWIVWFIIDPQPSG